MEEKKFRSVSVRTTFLEDIESLIDANPDFVRSNPEYNSVAGFVNESVKLKLQELKKQLKDCEVGA